MRCTAARGGALHVLLRASLLRRCRAAAPLLRRRASPPAATRLCIVASLDDAQLYTPRLSHATPLPEPRASVTVLPPVAPPASASVALTAATSWPLLVALLLAAVASCASAVSLFLLAMWPTLKATERASLATEAAMRAFEEASRATTAASAETERLMLRTQAELPATLSAVEDAALQFDRLGLEIRDSGRRFGLTNPAASASALAARTAEADPLAALAASEGSGTLDSALLAPLLPGAEAVSAAVGRLVDEAAAVAQTAALEVVAAADAPANVASAELLDNSLRALREWRTKLDRVVMATRDVAGGVGAVVAETVEDAAAAVALRREREKKRDAAADALQPAPADEPPATATEQEAPPSGPGWLGGVRKGAGAVGGVVAGASGKVASATVDGFGVAGGFIVAASASLVTRVASTLPWVPKPGDAEQLPSATRGKAKAKAALPAAPTASPEPVAPAAMATEAVDAPLQAQPQVQAHAQAPPPSLSAAPTESELREARERAVTDALAAAESSAAEAREASHKLGRLGAAARGSKAAARAAQSALSAAFMASGALLDALQRARAAGDAISPTVLTALEALPRRLEFDDDSYDPADAELGDEGADDDDEGSGDDEEQAPLSWQ